jgi:hypothetical protein
MTGFLTLLTTALPTQVQVCLLYLQKYLRNNIKNGINFLKLRAGWGLPGFATGYPVANTIDGVARNFQICV